jgi:hypothetical protein
MTAKIETIIRFRVQAKPIPIPAIRHDCHFLHEICIMPILLLFDFFEHSA